MQRVATLALILTLASGCTRPTSQKSSDQNSSTIKQIPSPQARLDISDWRAYSDRVIAFKYPPEFAIAVDAHPNLPVSISLSRQSDYIVPIVVTYQKDTFGASIQKFYKDSNLQYSTTTIDGRDAYAFISGDKMQTWYIVFANGMAFDLNAAQPQSNEDYKHILNVFETLLSTVQFR